MSDLPQHTDLVVSLLHRIEHERDALLKLVMKLAGAPGAPMFFMDHLALGAAKRAISTASAFRMMIESWNMTCARSLLRLHIDTALRFSAAWLVDDPHGFAQRVLQDERIDKMKDKDGNRLTDAHLVKVRSSDYPWLPAVYERLCGYVHFSGSHLYDSIASLDGEESTISWHISEADLKFPESSWVEVAECFCEGTAILEKFMHGYIFTKNLSPEEFRAAREAFKEPQKST